jgi:hypothetical protein
MIFMQRAALAVWIVWPLAALAHAAEPATVSYRNDLIPALGKLGCSTAECHGAPSGKGGFKLSLWGHDPAADYDELTARADETAPGASLILRKPLLKEKHGGGRRMQADDAWHKIIHDWIAAGCPNDLDAAPVAVSIDVEPAHGGVVKLPAAATPLRVTARYADGSRRDITHLAAYSCTNEEVARVDALGAMAGSQRGEASAIVRYLDQIRVSSFTFVEDVPGFTWTDPPAANYVDQLVHAKLRQLSYAPAELCGDEDFIRRVHLDVVGLLPAIETVLAFLDDTAVDKRARLIDELLERPEHAKFFAQRWGDIVQLTVSRLGREPALAYNAWLEQAWASNMPYDQFMRTLLTAEGSAAANPPANFLRMGEDNFELMEAVGGVLLGTQIQCAKCHNHPVERWTQSDYYGLSHYFHRIDRRKDEKDKQTVTIALGEPGEIVHPVTKRPTPAWLPGAGAVELPADADPRQALADWLVLPENPLFAHVEVNRLCGWLLGKGPVEPGDDFRETNPPANGELLDALARDFVAHNYDRRHLLRTILNSRTYQAAARTNEFNRDDTRYFSHYMPRKLTAEQTLDAIGHVTGVFEKFKGLPESVRATQLPAPDAASNDFLKMFGQPPRDAACQCERPAEAGLGAALAMFNGPLVQSKLRAREGRIQRGLASKKTDAELVEELFLAAYCRRPRAEELAAAARYVARGADRAQAFEDFAWALLNTNEFLHQH